MLCNFKIKEKTGFKKPKCEKKMAILHEEPGQEKEEKEGIQRYAQEHESEKRSVSLLSHV